MSDLFDYSGLMLRAREASEGYRAADPFPHGYFDHFADPDGLSEVAAAFPSPDDLPFYVYDNPLERKLAFDQVRQLPGPLSLALREMNSPPFLLFLEALTGIKGLIGDPYYRGGGVHQTLPGGKLDVHLDFNRHRKLGLDRRVNVLIYLNEGWEERR